MYKYQGTELELFSLANNWKRYYSKFITPLLGNLVLEVGSGIGGTTLILNTNSAANWVCLDPDEQMANIIQQQVDNRMLPKNCTARVGTIKSLSLTEKFDSIIYIDVLEHIMDDYEEIEDAIEHLTQNGNLIILSPAHNWLYSQFDKEIGHFRRYNRQSLNTLPVKNLRHIKTFYLDSAGMFASLLNRYLLKQKLPTENQIKTWDRFIIPISRILDPIFGYHVGKTIIAVWQNGTK